MAKTIDYEFKRGETYPLKKFRIKDKAGNIIQLTDAEELYFTMKTDNNTSNAILQKRIGTGIELGEDGYYHITMEPADTNGLDYMTYSYDIQLKSISPKVFVRTLIDGTITLTEETTWEVNE